MYMTKLDVANIITKQKEALLCEVKMTAFWDVAWSTGLLADELRSLGHLSRLQEDILTSAP
jgi:hypothetical protein